MSCAKRQKEATRTFVLTPHTCTCNFVDGVPLLCKRPWHLQIPTRNPYGIESMILWTGKNPSLNSTEHYHIKYARRLTSSALQPPIVRHSSQTERNKSSTWQNKYKHNHYEWDSGSCYESWMVWKTCNGSMRKHELMNWVPSWLLIFVMFMYVFNVCIINLFWAVRWTWSNWCHVCHELYGPLGPLGPSITEAALSLPHLPKTSASRGPWVAYRFSFSWELQFVQIGWKLCNIVLFFFCDTMWFRFRF